MRRVAVAVDKALPNITLGPPSDAGPDHRGGCTCAIIGQSWPGPGGTDDEAGAHTVYVSLDRAQAADVAERLLAYAGGAA
jgi:hypothetical protein